MEVKLDARRAIEHFGGITPLYERFIKENIKISRKAIEKWKERDSIPTNSWLQIEAMAERDNSLGALRQACILKEEAALPSYKTEKTFKHTNKNILNYYKKMLQIRRFEEKAGQLYGMGMIGGFCHLYIGQEAVAVGTVEAKEPGDQVITTYRDHGLMLACGSDPKVVMAELMGREDGCSKGKGGSMHMFDLKNHFYGGHGIVGAPVPIGAGIAFANKYRGDGRVCFTFFGDGAVNQGQVYETFNMAALWKLPVIFIIENNEYAMGTSTARSSTPIGMELYNRGQSLGIIGAQVDGMDVLKVYEETKKALDFVRAGNGCYILEMKTYRYRGHSMSDPAKYRSKEEVSNIKEKKDPIENLRKKILKEAYTTEEELKALDKEIREELNNMAEICKNSPEPDACELYTDVCTAS